MAVEVDATNKVEINGKVFVCNNGIGVISGATIENEKCPTCEKRSVTVHPILKEEIPKYKEKLKWLQDFAPYMEIREEVIQAILDDGRFTSHERVEKYWTPQEYKHYGFTEGEMRQWDKLYRGEYDKAPGDNFEAVRGKAQLQKPIRIKFPMLRDPRDAKGWTFPEECHQFTKAILQNVLYGRFDQLVTTYGWTDERILKELVNFVNETLEKRPETRAHRVEYVPTQMKPLSKRQLKNQKRKERRRKKR